MGEIDELDQGERPTTLSGIDEAIHACRRCPIGLLDNQAVMGEGPKKAELMIVGEQPIVQPRLILALGGSAARGVLGKPVTIGKMRGAPHPLEDGSELWVTAHPSYLLRLRDEMKEQQQHLFQADLAAVAERLAELVG